MRQNQFVRHCCSFLMACILVFMMSGGVVYAQESYTVEVGNQLFPVYPSLYSSRGQVMVPLKGLTEARQKKLCKSRQATVKRMGANRGSKRAEHSPA